MSDDRQLQALGVVQSAGLTAADAGIATVRAAAYLYLRSAGVPAAVADLAVGEVADRLHAVVAGALAPVIEAPGVVVTGGIPVVRE